jgi:hypothetical protein
MHKRLHHVISVDDMKQFKLTPASYTLVLDRLGVKREEVYSFHLIHGILPVLGALSDEPNRRNHR